MKYKVSVTINQGNKSKENIPGLIQQFPLQVHNSVQVNTDLRHLHRPEQAVLQPHVINSMYDTDIGKSVIQFWC